MKPSISVRLINYIAASYVLLFVFVPPVQVGTVYRLLAIAATVIWFFTGKGFGSICISKKGAKFIILSAICALGLIFTSSFIHGISEAITKNLQFIIVCIVGYMSLYYFENDAEFFDKWMTLALIVIFFFCITTIQGIAVDPRAARIANSAWLEERFEGRENVGLYGYVYMCIMLFPLLLYKILGRIKVNKIFDIFCVLDAIVIFIMSITAGYMIGICCLFVGTLMVLLLRKLSYVRILIVISLIIFFIVAYEPIVEMFFDIFFKLLGDNPVYYEKIIDFRELFLNGSATGATVEGRFKNYAASIREIIEYPFFGSYIHGAALGGGHSTFFDTIGKRGWIIAVLYFYIMWRFPFEIYQGKNRKFNIIKVCTLVLLVIFAVFDPYSQEIAMTSMVFLPYFLFIEDRQSKDNSADISDVDISK